jgi:hypothetical protein
MMKMIKRLEFLISNYIIWFNHGNHRNEKYDAWIKNKFLQQNCVGPMKDILFNHGHYWRHKKHEHKVLTMLKHLEDVITC